MQAPPVSPSPPPSQRLCPNCGYPYDPRAAFCPTCGRRFAKQTSCRLIASIISFASLFTCGGVFYILAVLVGGVFAVVASCGTQQPNRSITHPLLGSYSIPFVVITFAAFGWMVFEIILSIRSKSS